MDVIAMIKSGCDAIAGVFGYVKQRDAELNSAVEQSAALAKQQQGQRDQVNQNVAAGDLSLIRKDDAE